MELIENKEYGYCCLITATQRILDAYDKSCFKFMEHFLRASFKYKENPSKYADTSKNSKLAVSEQQMLQICKTEKSLKEITECFGYKDVYKFKNNYINKLLEENKLKMTILVKPNSKNQKYLTQ